MNKPHIVKFSGGRSSGMMLMELLKQGALCPERGDVIVFNNTSAEHPATYVFTRSMKQLAEDKYDIPFFWIEYQTYEDAGRHGWKRNPTYRLVNEFPFSEDNPHGYRWQGEVFEEMVSHIGFLPNMQSRVCTQNLKIRTTNELLSDWLAQKDGIERLGHNGDEPKMSAKEVIRYHQANRGKTPDNILLAKKSFSREQPFIREAAMWKDFTRSRLCMNNESIKNSVLGGKGQLFGDRAIAYVSCLGIRKDEEIRVEKIRDRIASSQNQKRRSPTEQPPRESIWVPLVDNNISKQDVIDFWKKQPFDLDLPDNGIFSNCVYCPLKGRKKLMQIAQSQLAQNIPDNTPASIDWWIEMERKYSRDLKAEKRLVRSKKNVAYISFFGATDRWVYSDIKNQLGNTDADYLEDESYIPCNCTD